MLRYKTETRPGLVALYDIRPGNGAGPFLQPRSSHGAYRVHEWPGCDVCCDLAVPSSSATLSSTNGWASFTMDFTETGLRWHSRSLITEAIQAVYCIRSSLHSQIHFNILCNFYGWTVPLQNFYNENLKSAHTQTLRAGCSKTDPKIFTPPQTPFPVGVGCPKFRPSLVKDWWMQFRVIVVTDPPTNTARPPQTGPITIHCAAKLSVQCSNN